MEKNGSFQLSGSTQNFITAQTSQSKTATKKLLDIQREMKQKEKKD
jgi:hypothetical protein